jgi:hypothetical protein
VALLDFVIGKFESLRTSFLDAPVNGKLPDKRKYMITPHDHKSHFSVYFPFIISGAM